MRDLSRRDWFKASLMPLFEGVEAMESNTTSALEEHASETGFAATLERLVAAIERAGLTVFARIDHAAAARTTGLAMPPTVVLLYGNPKGGTPIMLAVPRAALDLPLRVLLREGSDGKAWLSFRPVAPALREAGVAIEMTARLTASEQVVLQALRL